MEESNTFWRWMAGPYAKAMDRERVVKIATRLPFLLITAILLAVVCRQGASLLGVGTVFILYIAAATLWISGQHQASIKAAQSGRPADRPWTFPYLISLLILLIGGGLLAYGAARHVGSFLFAGVLCVYFSAGYGLMRFRQRGTDGEGKCRVPTGVVLLIVSVAFALVGLLLMKSHGWTVILVAGGIVLLVPAGLSVLAEPAVDWLHGDESGRRVAAFFITGALLLGGSALIAVKRLETTQAAYVVIAFAALGLLVFAIVSSTQADIAAVIAAVSLMGITSAADRWPDELTPKSGDQRVLVALGDSYMSGEGAQTYYEAQADSGGKGSRNHCHRSPTAWAAIAGRNDFDSMAFLACSGAKTSHVRYRADTNLPGPAQQYNEPGPQLAQVDAFEQGISPSLVVISLGGNDAGFSTIGAMCIAPGNCGSQSQLWTKTLKQVSAGLAATYQQIREKFPEAPILVTAYPAPAYVENGRAVKCGQVALSQGDLDFISSFVASLNSTIRAAALAKKFYFLGEMEGALATAHLQLCDPANDDQPGVNFIGLRSVAGIAEQRFNPKNWYHNSLHPNARGHLAMLQVFERWMKQHPNLQAVNPQAAAQAKQAPTGSTVSADAVEDPPCDLIKDEQSNKLDCRQEGAKWARGELSHTLLGRWWGLQIGAAVAGAWLFGVAFYGWRKPWWSRRRR